MPLWSRLISLALGLCGVLLARPAAADLPSLYSYDVRVNGRTVTRAIIYHADAMLRGKDPESGVTYVLASPEWTGLEIEGASYTFRVEPPGGSSHYPFEPTWILRLQDVRFSTPPKARPSEVCRKRPAHVILKNAHGAVGGGMSAYRDCPALFPKGEAVPPYAYLTLEDVKGLPFVRIDVSAAREVVRRCQQGNKAACEQVYQRYRSLKPGHEESRCEFEVAGHAQKEPDAADEQECLFQAYYTALKGDCRPPRCGVKYRWGDPRGQPIPDSAWKPVPFPPPLDQHERLFPAKPAHVPFKQIVQRCQQQDRDACMRVSYGYYGLPRPEGLRTSCYIDAGGKKKFNWMTRDAEECAFFAYYEALDNGCRLPGCTVRYLFQATRTVPESPVQETWPVEGWQALTSPPPIDKHERLMSANTW